MVFYKPVTDRTEIEKLFTGVTLDKAYVYGAYTAIENEDSVGSCLVRVDKYKCYVSNLSTCHDDPLLTEGLIRSALNFAANRNAYMAYCSQQELKSVLDLLGFEYKDNIWQGDIPTLLQGSCCKGK